MNSRKHASPGPRRRVRPFKGLFTRDRHAASWRRAAREASDPGSLRSALYRLGAAPADLIVGPEPTPLPPGRGRSSRLRRYRPVILWLLAAGAFGLTTEYLVDNSSLAPVLIPLLAVLIALPLGLAAETPLRAWRVQMLVAMAAPLLVPALDRQGLPWPPTLIFIALYVLYTVAARLDLHLLIGVWLVTGAAVFWGYLFTGLEGNNLGEVNLTIVLVTIVMAYGYLLGTRRRLQQELVEGRQRQEEDQARRALLEERARIARELHDIVAHHMSVIAVRTETAPFRIPELPQAAREDLAETSAIARDALTEMRRLLGVLRGADTSAELAPQPGIDRLEALIAAVRGAGLAVDLRVHGPERPLPPGVGLSAYRIIQEALSNTLRHAPGARATVEVGYEPGSLWIRVRNDAPAVRADRVQPASPGQGIIGMRERAAMLGGTVSTGPTSDGGYLVEAALPLGEPGPPGQTAERSDLSAPGDPAARRAPPTRAETREGRP
ncbi:MAG TPA: sensor histidine kinase [Actinomycetes bacterium]|nr:sensor histidine kinase [Actinomycetes bacterium]